MTHIWIAEGRKLKISWHVELVTSNHFGVTSKPHEHRHEISIEHWALENPSKYLETILLMLCQAKLAECINPNFSSVLFDTKNYESRMRWPEKNVAVMHDVSRIWCIANIWPRDLRFQLWPDLMRSWYQESAKRALADNKNECFVFPSEDDKVAFLSQILSEEERYQLPHYDISPIMDSMGDSKRRQVKKIARYCSGIQDMPLGEIALNQALRIERAEGLRILEKSVQCIARLFEYSFSPQLTYNVGERSWKID